MMDRRCRTWSAGRVFRFMIAAIAFVIFGFLGTSAALAQSGHQQGQNLPESAKAAQVRPLNNALLQLHGQIQEGSPSDASGLRSQAAPVIAERAAALKSLIEENPRAALSFADKIKTPLLMIHGEADDNSGTFPVQSERFFSALKGHGATVRFVLLPLEAHGYAGRESILHMFWEMNNWLNTYVKNPGSAATTASR
jgi:hypothetical protein